VLHGFEKAFGCRVLEGYGLSETSPVASFNLPDRERKPGSIGTPVRGVQMRVVDKEDHEVPQGEVRNGIWSGDTVSKLIETQVIRLRRRGPAGHDRCPARRKARRATRH
jgi:long-chain acyl-CoA synthetase